MKKVQLTKGKITIIDDSDFSLISQSNWVAKYNDRGYVYAFSSGVKSKAMHRIIMNANNNEYIDHINGDTLDNRRINLRKCTKKQNSWNARKSKNNTSGFRGVRFRKEFRFHKNPWEASLSISGKRKYLGYFSSKEQAAEAYKKGSLNYYGEFSYFAKRPEVSTSI